MCDVWCDGWWWVVVCGGVWWCVVWCDVMLPWGCRGDFVMVPWCAAFLLNGVLCYSSVIMALCSEHIIWACARKTRSSPVVALCSTEYDAIVCSKRYGILRRWLCNKFGTESENHTNRNRGPCFVRFLESPQQRGKNNMYIYIYIYIYNDPIFNIKGASKPNFHITSETQWYYTKSRSDRCLVQQIPHIVPKTL